MTTIVGYGEDSLTFWAVTERLDLLLKQLGDNADQAGCLVIYRPSFGRAGLVGEFDAIIVTPRTAYLVESKWDQSKMPNNVLKLDEGQIRRHRILKWYHENWIGEDWKKFTEKHAGDFKKKFHRLIAPEGSLLSKNLITVLTKIRGRELRNVLLFFHRGELPQIDTDFEVVLIEYKPTHGNYIELKSACVIPKTKNR